MLRRIFLVDMVLVRHPAQHNTQSTYGRRHYNCSIDMMRSLFVLPVVAIASYVSCTAAFQPSLNVRSSTIQRSSHVTATRRDIVEAGGALSSMVAIVSLTTSLLTVLPKQVLASGGATAGGAYLLSAKQRYNTRVTKGVANFVGLKSALEKADIDTLRTYFSTDEDGAWKDFTAAGYLLANAFRTNSSAAPDSLPSVKKWKAFTGQVEVMSKSLKKKDVSAALLAHGDAVVALDEYLAKVDLQ